MRHARSISATSILCCGVILVEILCLIDPTHCFSNRPPSQGVLAASDELVDLLLSKQNPQWPSNANGKSRIEELVDELVNARVSFDPMECLDGPLYVSYVISGQSPVWQKLGGKRQGQQYTFRDEEKSVINYAEILGTGLHLRAYGVYEAESTPPMQIERNEMPNWFSLFPRNARLSKKMQLQCPVEFVVTVNRASLVIPGKCLDVPISGKGYLRVLYADKRLRIFISPSSTASQWQWEKTELIVAQIRVDLIDPTFPILQ